MTARWQSIDTAPRRSVPFLAWQPEDEREAAFAACYYSIDDTLCYDVGGIVDENEFTPTHWFPLPDPPEAA